MFDTQYFAVLHSFLSCSSSISYYIRRPKFENHCYVLWTEWQTCHLFSELLSNIWNWFYPSTPSFLSYLGLIKSSKLCCYLQGGLFLLCCMVRLDYEIEGQQKDRITKNKILFFLFFFKNPFLLPEPQNQKDHGEMNHINTKQTHIGALHNEDFSSEFSHPLTEIYITICGSH